MPEAFESCVQGGGRVRRKTLKNGKYINICFKGGKSYAGYVKRRKRANKPVRHRTIMEGRK